LAESFNRLGNSVKSENAKGSCADSFHTKSYLDFVQIVVEFGLSLGAVPESNLSLRLPGIFLTELSYRPKTGQTSLTDFFVFLAFLKNLIRIRNITR